MSSRSDKVRSAVPSGDWVVGNAKTVTLTEMGMAHVEKPDPISISRWASAGEEADWVEVAHRWTAATAA